MKNKPTLFPYTETIAFDLGNYDTHGCYDMSIGMYIIPVSGNYIINDGDLFTEVELKCGDAVTATKLMREGSPLFSAWKTKLKSFEKLK